MHLYVPTLYVYVYRKFGEKGRPVEREKRDENYIPPVQIPRRKQLKIKIIDNREPT